MRVATFVLGVSLLITGVSEGSENRSSPVAHRAAAVLADGMMSAPVSPLVANDRALSPSALQYAREPAARGFNAMGYVPTQNPANLLRAYPNFVEPLAPRAEARFDPGASASTISASFSKVQFQRRCSRSSCRRSSAHWSGAGFGRNEIEARRCVRRICAFRSRRSPTSAKFF